MKLDPKRGNCFRLRKALYGLKQAAREWRNELEACLLNIGFIKSLDDPSLFLLNRDEAECFLLVSVDDILIIGNGDDLLRAIERGH